MKKFVSLLFVACFVFAFVGCQRGKVQDKMPIPQTTEDRVIVPSQTETPEPEAPQTEDNNTSVDDEIDDANESNEPTSEDPPVEDSPQVEENDTSSDDATLESEDWSQKSHPAPMLGGFFGTIPWR